MKGKKMDVRFPIALFMDSTDGICYFCKHKFIDVDDVIERNIVLIEKGLQNTVACEECYIRNKSAN